MSKILSLEDNAEIVYKQATEQVLKHTPQLFTISKKRKISTHCSAVLVTNNIDFFLLTAAHCLKHANKMVEVFMLISGRFESIKGPVMLCHGLEGKNDIAIVKLQSDFITICKRAYNFLPIDSFLSNSGIPDETLFLIVGYPLSKTDINHKESKITSEPFVFITKSKKISHTKITILISLKIS